MNAILLYHCCLDSKLFFPIYNALYVSSPDLVIVIKLENVVRSNH